MQVKKVVKKVLCVLLALLVLAAGYVAYVLIDYHRIDDMQTLEVVEDNGGAGKVSPVCGVEYRITSANIGFGAYSADYSFFMDGGKESRARSIDAVRENVTGEADFIADLTPDFALFQEVDLDGTRSHHVDERAYLVRAMGGQGVDEVFAQNYDSPYLLYPFTSPHGANKSGLLTFSAFRITSALRRSLPIETSLMKLVDLDRCYSVSRIDMANGKELVLYNLHLSAYTSDGTIAVAQLQMLCDDMKEEAQKGNYCIAGGDFNKDLPGHSGDVFGVQPRETDNWAQPIPDGTIPSELTLVVPFNAQNPVASCRSANEAYNPETTFRVTVDGFLVSQNVEAVAADVVDTGFAFSDHNPVYMDFILK